MASIRRPDMLPDTVLPGNSIITLVMAPGTVTCSQIKIDKALEIFVEDFQQTLTDEGYGEPTRSVYFFWVDRYIVEHKELTAENVCKFVKRMIDGIFIRACECYDFSGEQYLLVCKFTLNLYDVVFFLPNREGYLAGNKYFMRIKGKVDLVSLRQLFKVFRNNMPGQESQ